MVKIQAQPRNAAVALPDLQQPQVTLLNAIRAARAVRALQQSLAAVLRGVRQPAASPSHRSSTLWWQRSWW